MTQSGLALQATIKGTRYWRDPQLNRAKPGPVGDDDRRSPRLIVELIQSDRASGPAFPIIPEESIKRSLSELG